MTSLVRRDAFQKNAPGLDQSSLLQQPRGETQPPLCVEPGIDQSKGVSIDAQPHHLDAFAEARRTAKVVGNLGVYAVGGERCKIESLADLQRSHETRQAP
ncbi:hypothetical protein VO64_2791 [Pseudomonas synxantha]|uniref:Uncharacterized protein n=1 Tax=Pseudomonas synxantha TaxID=47883 RepID=A0AAU8TYN5_9PSED|nr:hypothetical protein VO64_2791 [Pseudomonas synxantha]